MVSLTIKFTEGNLLEADVEALVNTVNTVGIMVALMFKERFPRNFEAYARACAAGEVRLGRMYVTENKEPFGPRWIVNFPTKTHWRVKTQIEWVQEGLNDLVRIIAEKDIRSIAIPALGCGNGGLDWREVAPLVTCALQVIEGINVIVYKPATIYQNVTNHKGMRN